MTDWAEGPRFHHDLVEAVDDHPCPPGECLDDGCRVQDVYEPMPAGKARRLFGVDVSRPGRAIWRWMGG